MLKPVQGLQALDRVNLVLIKPEFLKHNTLLEAGGASNPIVSQVKLLDVPQLIESLYGIEIVLGHPALFKIFAPVDPLKKWSENVYLPP